MGKPQYWLIVVTAARYVSLLVMAGILKLVAVASKIVLGRHPAEVLGHVTLSLGVTINAGA